VTLCGQQWYVFSDVTPPLPGSASYFPIFPPVGGTGPGVTGPGLVALPFGCGVVLPPPGSPPPGPPPGPPYPPYPPITPPQPCPAPVGACQPPTINLPPLTCPQPIVNVYPGGGGDTISNIENVTETTNVQETINEIINNIENETNIDNRRIYIKRLIQFLPRGFAGVTADLNDRPMELLFGRVGREYETTALYFLGLRPMPAEATFRDWVQAQDAAIMRAHEAGEAFFMNPEKWQSVGAPPETW